MYIKKNWTRSTCVSKTPEGWSYSSDTSHKTLCMQISERIQLVTHSNSHCLWSNNHQTKKFKHKVELWRREGEKWANGTQIFQNLRTRHQKCDMKQVSHWGPTFLQWPVNLLPGIFCSVYMKLYTFLYVRWLNNYTEYIRCHCKQLNHPGNQAPPSICAPLIQHCAFHYCEPKHKVHT
jgi:hypothetical protein